MTQSRIKFWRQDKPLGNFGDALTLVFLKRVLQGNCYFQDHDVHLIGSVITSGRLKEIMAEARAGGLDHGQAVYWGCGRKDDLPLAPDLLAQCVFRGVRGVLSRDALGLPKSTPLGDTALLLPRFYQPGHDPATAGKVLWVPHIHYDDPGPEDLDGCPDYTVMRPTIPNTAEACEQFIDAIASARFVMANAMHAAVVALAYGTPFAFWPGSGINAPFKWRDFTSVLGLELDFHRTFASATAGYDATRPDRAFADVDMAPLLDVAPYDRRPSLR